LIEKRFMKINENIKIKYSFLKLLIASDLVLRRVPLMLVESTNPGPVLWLTACIHGDEVSGIVIIQEIFKIIKKTLLKGKVFAFPLLNPIGFEHSSRFITLSEEDLNRSFPGKKEGTLSERIAYQIFNKIIETKPTLVLDLHNDWIRSIPFTLIDYGEDIIHTEAYEKSKIFAKQTGLLPIIDTEEIPKSLSYSLIKNGIPSLTLELGEPYIINEKSVEIGVKSVMNILRDLEMVESTEKPFIYPLPEELLNKFLKYSFQASSTSGIIRFYIKPGDMVKKGQVVAKTYNAFGKLQETITALKDGIVLGHEDYSVAYPGAQVVSFGTF